MGTIRVVDPDPAWPHVFEALKAPVAKALAGLALGLEHVGSTAVAGLAARPIVDIDVVIPSRAELPEVIERLAGLGYAHQGDRGIPGREAFESPAGLPAHHLYVCIQGGVALANHLTVRESLRRNPEAARRYGQLKKQLAAQVVDDVDSYVAGKTDFLLQILAEAGFPQAALLQIHDANHPRRAGSMRLRPATRADLELLRSWDSQAHLIAARAAGAWGGEHDLARTPAWREQLIAELDGRPLGFVQIIDPAREDSHYWGELGEGLRAIDIWIGEPGELGRGHGTSMMRLALERCFADPGVAAVLVDPLASNTRAHRFFERLGFELIGQRLFGEDDCRVYRLTRGGRS